MNSLSPECTPLKHKYDACFNRWFDSYLQLVSLPGEAPKTDHAQAVKAKGNAESDKETLIGMVRRFLVRFVFVACYRIQRIREPCLVLL